MEFPTIDKFAKEVAEKALDEITYEGKTVREWVEILVNQQPSEDCISRAEMLKYQEYLHGKMSNEENHELWKFIKGLPPVTPQPDVGKWIKVYPLGMDYEAYMCSKCKTGDWNITIGEYKFCPYCGQKKEGVEDEEA